MKENLRKILFSFILFFLPLFIGWLVSFNVFDWIEIQNDWLGFWGGYLGGLCTLGGVIITINNSKMDSNLKQRMSVIPYISIERNSSIDIDETKIPMGLAFVFSESKDNNHLLFFDEIKIIGKCKSVGLGPIINCGIRDIKIGERKIDHDTSKVSVLTVNNESYFILWFLSIGFYSEHLKRELIEYYNEFWSPISKHHQYPELDIEFYFYFENVVGNEYKQKVIYTGQLINNPNSSISDSINFLFKSISKPELTNKIRVVKSTI